MGGSPTLAAPAHPAATSLAAPSPELAQASSKKGGGVAISPLLLPLNIVLPSFLSVSLAWLVSLRHGRRPSPVLVDWIWAWAGWIWWWRDGSGSPRPDLHRTVGSGGSAARGDGAAGGVGGRAAVPTVPCVPGNSGLQWATV
jgi:hypothetical protein